MAKAAKRNDGLYQKNIVVGRNPDGSYIRKTIYGKTRKELDIKASEMVPSIVLRKLICRLVSAS